MLYYADHVLGDLRRWWTSFGSNLSHGPSFEEVFEYFCSVGSQAHAAWSVLPAAGGDYRAYPVLEGGLVPVVILLAERHGDVVVHDVRFLDSGR
ncbi:MAG: hypothetical protein ACRBI6_07490 [Acidimicrobiales bacterium]